MTGLLHVLQYPRPDAPRLHSQRIKYTDPPRRGRRFEMRPRSGPPWKTASVELDPQLAGDGAVWFKTAYTAYLLEPLPELEPTW